MKNDRKHVNYCTQKTREVGNVAVEWGRQLNKLNFYVMLVIVFVFVGIAKFKE